MVMQVFNELHKEIVQYLHYSALGTRNRNRDEKNRDRMQLVLKTHSNFIF